MTASCIIFVLYGPVPKRRKITIVSRLSPPDPFAQRPAAALVGFPTQHYALPEVQPPPLPPVKDAEPLVAPLKLRRPREGSSPPQLRPRSPSPASLTPQPRSASPQPHSASLTPTPQPRTPQPRNAPTPLPRSRSARGTERKPRPSELDLGLVTQDATLDNTAENTLETPRYSIDDMDTSAFPQTRR